MARRRHWHGCSRFSRHNPSLVLFTSDGEGSGSSEVRELGAACGLVCAQPALGRNAAEPALRWCSWRGSGEAWAPDAFPSPRAAVAERLTTEEAKCCTAHVALRCLALSGAVCEAGLSSLSASGCLLRGAAACAAPLHACVRSCLVVSTTVLRADSLVAGSCVRGAYALVCLIFLRVC